MAAWARVDMRNRAMHCSASSSAGCSGTSARQTRYSASISVSEVWTKARGASGPLLRYPRAARTKASASDFATLFSLTRYRRGDENLRILLRFLGTEKDSSTAASLQRVFANVKGRPLHGSLADKPGTAQSPRYVARGSVSLPSPAVAYRVQPSTARCPHCGRPGQNSCFRTARTCPRSSP